MNKSELNRFIELYNLNGTIDSVKIVSDGDSLKTNFVSEDKTLAGILSFSNIKIEKGEYGIYDTGQLKKMIGVLEENIEITINKNDTRPISWGVSDGSTDSTVMLADLSVIPAAPKVKELKSYDVEIPIDDAFIERYVRAKNALTETETFTLLINKKDKMELVIGYSGINTNRIKLEVTPVVGKDKLDKPISFNANYFKEIIGKAKGLGGTVFKISLSGISNITFGNTDFSASYYLIKKEIDN